MTQQKYKHVDICFFRLVLLLCAISMGNEHLCTSTTNTIEAKKSNSLRTTVNLTHPSTIYHCYSGFGNGMGELKAVFSSIFPESSIVDLSDYISGRLLYEDMNMIHTKTNDIFLGLFHPIGCGEPISQWLYLGFRGSIVIHSPESPHTHPDLNRMLNNIHYFGPVKESAKTENDVLLTYLQTVWWSNFQKELPVSTLIYGQNQSNQQLSNSFFMIYAQGNCVEFRDIAAWEFSQYGVVHLGGRCGGLALDGNRTNLQRIKTGITLGNWRDNTKLYRRYRFCLVMEHEKDHSAYITEKVLLAFIGGCIPVYHGPPLIFDIFNEDVFVYYNLSDPHSAHFKVQELEADPGLYMAMKSAPILANGENTLKKYFSFSENVGKGTLKHKIRHLLSTR